MRIVRDIFEALIAKCNGETLSIASAYLAEVRADDGLQLGTPTRRESTSRTELVPVNAAAPSKIAYVPTCLEAYMFGSNLTLSAAVRGNVALLATVEQLVAMNEASANGTIVECGMPRARCEMDCLPLRNKGKLGLYELTSHLHSSFETENESTESSEVFYLRSLRRLKGRASDQLSRTQASFRQLFDRAASHYFSAIEGLHGTAIRVALQVVSFVAVAAGGLSLLLEAKDWIRAASEALFNQVKDASVSLVSTSTTALGRQARSALFLASMSGLALLCFGRRLVATGITRLRRLKGRASDQLSRTQASFRQLFDRAASHYFSAIEGLHGTAIRVALQVVSFVAIAAGGLSLLLEAKDWVRAASEALFNQVKDASVSLVSRSTTALGRQTRSTTFDVAFYDFNGTSVSLVSTRRLQATYMSLG
ncbi:hypothetical protein THAOC_03398 [Thalassiosira oceanica]|uniref:Uncharacterized protein n=1 Tax=Thalassiosira oceanica TaxID=159749 RepID=K0TL01_THAOC|nr:hypothetical protein THAOC_03398 [Thalassiosira oceanica]|eukprot:EJK74896.1 hypothetical protein THAOC_03398 [Thalassiosira oceanica]